jgi:hypothetical protein
MKLSTVTIRKVRDRKVYVARKYIKMGLARDLGDRCIARGLGRGLYEILDKAEAQSLNFQYHSSKTGVAINAIAIRKADGKAIGAVNESDLFHNPAYEQPPFWFY